MNAKFKGRIDGDTFKGGWRPSPGADEKINTPYDIEGTRVASNRKSGSKARPGKTKPRRAPARAGHK